MDLWSDFPRPTMREEEKNLEQGPEEKSKSKGNKKGQVYNCPGQANLPR
jgi:hypothetical protein